MFDDNEGINFIRRSSEDKLTYKNVITNVIMQYLHSYGDFSSQKAVKKIKSAIFFDVTGYKLRSKIREFEQDLLLEREKKVEFEKKKLGRQFYGRANHARFMLRLEQWYWDSYFDCLLQLLADHNLLVDTEKTIPVMEVGKDSSEE